MAVDVAVAPFPEPVRHPLVAPAVPTNPVPVLIAREWQTALRSGVYAQTWGVLQHPEGHCGLGVLGAVLAHRGIVTSADLLYRAELPDPVWIASGIPGLAIARSLLHMSLQDWWTTVNDDLGWSFKRIARAVGMLLGDRA